MRQEPEVAIHPSGPTPGLIPVLPSVVPDSTKCEIAIHIGIFFDGTGNNKDWDDHDDCHVGQGTQLARRKESNVARLFFTYPDDPVNGFFSSYIHGIGTPFEPIGEVEPAMTGMAFGGGGDGRINFGLLQVINFLQRAVASDKAAYTPGEMKALCRNGARGEYLQRDGTVVRSPLASGEDEAALNSVGMGGQGGLLMDTVSGNRSIAKAFYKREAARIADIVKKTKKPKLVEIFIDVFGFSRGAASARTFCSWLDEMFEGDNLCGVPAKIRFLGIFDSVASVGVPNNPSETYGLTNGHFAWGAEQYLRIPERVKNCVHFVAMHENRPSFPLDRVWVNNTLPSNCHEYAFPGMHSDVGGGYGVNEQGRGKLDVKSSRNVLNSEKLSQIPLECMLNAAKAAKVPLNIDLAATQSNQTGYDPFQIDDGLRQAYANFHAACSPDSRQPGDWLITYLSWRYQVRNTYTQESWYSRCSASEKDDLVGANKTLLDDIDALEAGTMKLIGSAAYQSVKTFLSTTPVPVGGSLPESTVMKLRKLAPEAHEVLERMKDASVVSEAEAVLFSTYAHDSYAGFRPFDHQFKLKLVGCQKLMPGSWEPEGYIRYRRFYTGEDSARVYTVEIPEWEQEQMNMQNALQVKGVSMGDLINMAPH